MNNNIFKQNRNSLNNIFNINAPTINLPQKQNESKKEDNELNFLTSLSRLLLGADNCIACCFDNIKKELIISANNLGATRREGRQWKLMEEVLEALKTKNFSSDTKINYQPFIETILENTNIHNKQKLYSINDDLIVDYICWYFRKRDPSNLYFLVNFRTDKILNQKILKYIESFEHVLNSKYLVYLSSYVQKFTCTEETGLHCEIKILTYLNDEYKLNEDEKSFTIGTSLKICKHCHEIIKAFNKVRGTNFHIYARQTQDVFYNYRNIEIPKLIANDEKLQKEYRKIKEDVTESPKSSNVNFDSLANTLKSLSANSQKNFKFDSHIMEAITDFCSNIGLTVRENDSNINGQMKPISKRKNKIHRFKNRKKGKISNTDQSFDEK